VPVIPDAPLSLFLPRHGNGESGNGRGYGGVLVAFSGMPRTLITATS